MSKKRRNKDKKNIDFIREHLSVSLRIASDVISPYNSPNVSYQNSPLNLSRNTSPLNRSQNTSPIHTPMTVSSVYIPENVSHICDIATKKILLNRYLSQSLLQHQQHTYSEKNKEESIEYYTKTDEGFQLLLKWVLNTEDDDNYYQHAPGFIYNWNYNWLESTGEAIYGFKRKTNHNCPNKVDDNQNFVHELMLRSIEYEIGRARRVSELDNKKFQLNFDRWLSARISKNKNINELKRIFNLPISH